MSPRLFYVRAQGEKFLPRQQPTWKSVQAIIG